jgi:chromatin remodeling complex protein RSC6
MPAKSQQRKANAGNQSGLQKPLQPSQELAAVIGSGPLPRGQVVSKMWEYIRSHNLQNPENRREILADDKLRNVFGKEKVSKSVIVRAAIDRLAGDERNLEHAARFLR